MHRAQNISCVLAFGRSRRKRKKEKISIGQLYGDNLRKTYFKEEEKEV